MTETEFDNGYWYAEDLKKFAEKIGVPSARRLRKVGDLLRHAIELNRTKDGLLRIEHGRYVNFISDFMRANKQAPMSEDA